MKVSKDCLLLGGQKVNILVLFMLISRPIELQNSRRMLMLSCKPFGFSANRTRSSAHSRCDITMLARAGWSRASDLRRVERS